LCRRRVLSGTASAPASRARTFHASKCLVEREIANPGGRKSPNTVVPHPAWWKAIAAVALTVASATGCSSVDYYFQALNGQMELTRKARPIPEVVADPATSPVLKAKLGEVVQMRDFGSQALHLPNNGSYRRYADIGRPYVVWNVFAAPEFSVQPKEWCFPFAGCVGYKGYFSKTGAEQLAAELRAQHYDVFVGGVPAYSTLGWFDDPVLNTFVDYPNAEIARLMFHELAHQTVYVKGDSTFNESFAVTVEREGVDRWLAGHGTESQRRAFTQARVRGEAFAELVAKYRSRLAELYAEPLDPVAMRSRKQEVLAEMRAEYERMKQSWDGFTGYDWWFEQPLNNAQLASVAIYTQLVPAFERVLQDSGGDLQRFYSEVKRIADLPKAQRDAELATLSARHG
jgi:predicted aminopeptidase